MAGAVQHDWHAIFKVFCDAESYRYATDSPWVHRGFLLATDARILVAVQTDEPDSPPAVKRRVDAVRTLADFGHIEALNEWPALLPDCIKCGGDSEPVTYQRKCDECDGSGYQTCDLGHEHDCSECDGDGVEECKATDEGAEPVQSECGCLVEFCGLTFDRSYISKIAEHIPGPLTWGVAEQALKVVGADGVTAILMMKIRNDDQ